MPNLVNLQRTVLETEKSEIKVPLLVRSHCNVITRQKTSHCRGAKAGNGRAGHEGTEGKDEEGGTRRKGKEEREIYIERCRDGEKE